MSEQELCKWREKFRLWCILHGIPRWLHEYRSQIEDELCEKCPYHNTADCTTSSTIGPDLLWVNTEGNHIVAVGKRAEILHYPAQVTGRWFCIEWIKHV